MNRMRMAIGATVAIAVLALAIALFALRSGSGDTGETEPAPEVEAPEATVAYEQTEQGLFEAIRAKDSAAVERILTAGVSPNSLDPSGDPMLKYALIGRRSPEMVALLVAHGADVNLSNSAGYALLPQAARIGNVEIVQTLLDAGADPDGTLLASGGAGAGMWEATALNWAALENRVEIARVLIANGADVNLGDPTYERTPLHTASWKNNYKIVELLLESGADPNAASTWATEGRPLHFAIVGGSVQAVEALLAGGAEVDIQTGSGQTPLMFAQQEGHSGVRDDITRLLLEAGADPNLKNSIGNTALHQAARWDRTEAIPILVEHGASLDVQNERGETPLDLAKADRTIALLSELAAGQ